MSRIHLNRPHHGDRKEARAAIEEAAAQIAAHYDIHCAWEGDELHFRRPGVDGVMRIGEEAIEIDARLGFMLALLKAPIEREINRELDKHFT